jgi:hypothetical protein
MRMAMDYGDRTIGLEYRLHLFGVFGPEIPVAVVLVERGVRKDEQRRGGRNLGKVALEPGALWLAYFKRD